MTGLDWIRGSPVAHRGLHDIKKGVPENSRLAFDKAAAAGHPVELDVHITRDGVPVVFHDHDLKRLCGENGKVAELDMATLAQKHLHGTAQTIPSLADVCATMAGRAPILVEVKSGLVDNPGALEEQTAKVLDAYKGAFAVQSFNPNTIDWFRRRRPGWTRGQIANDLKGYAGYASPLTITRLAALLAQRMGEPQFVAYKVDDLPSGLSRWARDKGLPVIAWTVRNAAQKQRAAEFADNVIFEDLS